MKKHYAAMLGFVLCPMTITMFIAYLIGAFIATSWNPVEWTEHLRMVMFAFGFCYGVALWARLEWEYK